MKQRNGITCVQRSQYPKTVTTSSGEKIAIEPLEVSHTYELDLSLSNYELEFYRDLNWAQSKSLSILSRYKLTEADFSDVLSFIHTNISGSSAENFSKTAEKLFKTVKTAISKKLYLIILIVCCLFILFLFILKIILKFL